MDNAKVQLADKLKSANNILVTVSRDPSVDQLSACIGLTLLLNKLNKHAAAVFSGKVPSTLEFLKPEETIEKTTDSLRDFIIALDKHKADKLRYKVEDDVVRIFITPYKTSITQEDLEFSQGDFNVDVVIALGVQQQEDLDEAITSHGRILHDATVASVNTGLDSSLGSINWHNSEASSLSELVTELGQMLGKDLFDNQIATALLTGIVAETDRFSNSRTTSETMRASAVLMGAGADQQLVATKLAEPDHSEPEVASGVQSDNDSPSEAEPAKSEDGALEIDHSSSDVQEEGGDKPFELPEPQEGSQENADNEPNKDAPQEPLLDKPSVGLSGGSRRITEKPQLGGMLTANTQPEQLDPSIDPLSMLNPDVAPLLNRPSEEPVEQKAGTLEPLADKKAEAATENEETKPADETSQPVAETPELTPPPPDWVPPAPDNTNTPGVSLADLEKSLRSQTSSAREEVDKALSSTSGPLPPKQDLNAQYMGEPLHETGAPAMPPMNQPVIDADPTSVPVQAMGEHQDELNALNLNADPTLPTATPLQAEEAEVQSSEVKDPTAPPPVPPPFDPTKFSTEATPPSPEQPK